VAIGQRLGLGLEGWGLGLGLGLEGWGLGLEGWGLGLGLGLEVYRDSTKSLALSMMSHQNKSTDNFALANYY
jgi:hypothetical protein